MKEKILPFLIDPVSKEPLKVIKFETKQDSNGEETQEDIVSGVLVSDTGYVYPIYMGIPRLLRGALILFKPFFEQWKPELEKHNLLNEKALTLPTEEFKKFILPTLKMFEKEWKNHELNDTTWGWSQSERIEKVKEYFGWDKKDFEGKLILDAGAGTGQLTGTIAKELNCEVIGIDLTPSVMRGWIEKRKWAGDNHLNVHIIQADVNDPPFKDGIFEGVHSSGVLHHTPNTERAFKAIAPLTKDGGRLAVWLYKHIKADTVPLIPFTKFGQLEVAWLRKFTPKLNPTFLYVCIYIYSAVFHFFYKVNEMVRGKKHNQTIKERTTSLFDTLAPPYVYKHTFEEVKGWFENNGYLNIFLSDKENPFGFNVCGEKN